MKDDYPMPRVQETLCPLSSVLQPPVSSLWVLAGVDHPGHARHHARVLQPEGFIPVECDAFWVL